MSERAEAVDARVELLKRITVLENQLSQARNELRLLDSVSTPSRNLTSETENGIPSPAHVHAGSSPAEKMALFSARFIGRSDVYANRWLSKKTGKSGWSPAIRYGSDYRNPRPSDYLPLTASVLERHLRRDPDIEWHAGLYPLLENDQCRLLACDFDDGDWRRDAAAYAAACKEAGFDVLAEISRSGEGAHVWMFFDSAVPAATARAAGAQLLRRAMASCPSMSFESYDRFFPSQDKLPTQSTGRARFGNLIALPLSGNCRARSTSVFADPTTWVPFKDQFAELAKVRLADAESLTKIIGAGATNLLGPAENLPLRPQRAAIRAAAKEHLAAPGAEQNVRLRLDSVLHVPTASLPGTVIIDLKHLASIPNPEFYLRQAQRRSTYGTPRLVTCFEHDGEELRIPRGLLDETSLRLEDASFKVSVTKTRRKRTSIEVKFSGTLHKDQRAAVSAMDKHETGVLVAPPGAGKTVIACALIAKRQKPTAILVGNRELLAQWRTRLQEFLSLTESQIGQLGAGRRKRRGVVDLIMWQSIAHREGDPTILNEYGQIIIDECHRIAAPAIEAALRQVDAPRWLGLTATPYRADKMDGLITMQCGPIRHTMMQETVVKRELRIHDTQFATDETGSDGPSIQAIYTELAHDEARNTLVVDSVLDAATDGRCSLVLTNRIDHLDTLMESIRQRSSTPTFSLHGRLSPAERREVRDALAALVDSREPFTLVAIDKVAGEGLDLPTLDTLFLAVPISFKGRVIQQLGRITRGVAATSGKVALVHDFRDGNVPLFEAMHARRRRVMLKDGFTPAP
ncbi:TOTE conflict system archaeo-eukaryotic primase domain-containing protein [Leucobacter sp. HY1910]